MEEKIKQLLLQLLGTQQQQNNFNLQLSADLAALKSVVFALDARALPLFEEQLRKIRDTQQQQLESVRQATDSLLQAISKIQSPKSN
jgi:hypothetical protein